MSADPIRNRLPMSAAIYWFNRRRAGLMTGEDVRAFDVWARRNQEHAEAYKKLETAWASLSALEDDPALMEVRDQYENEQAGRARRQGALAMAAALLLAVAGGWTLNAAGVLSPLNPFTSPPAQEFRTKVGQQVAITLADRSVVTLDTDTVVRARFSSGERRVELVRGQAFFKVAKDKHRPFIVAAAGKTIRATGTAFDVRAEGPRFEVTLIEGRVHVKEQNAKGEASPGADMRPGWRLAIGQDERWRMEPVDIVRETSWHDGVLIFYDDPIQDAVAEMNRYSRQKIVLHGELPNRLVLGNFRIGDVEQFVRALESNRIARVVSENEERIEITAR